MPARRSSTTSALRLRPEISSSARCRRQSGRDGRSSTPSPKHVRRRPSALAGRPLSRIGAGAPHDSPRRALRPRLDTIPLPAEAPRCWRRCAPVRGLGARRACREVPGGHPAQHLPAHRACEPSHSSQADAVVSGGFRNRNGVVPLHPRRGPLVSRGQPGGAPSLAVWPVAAASSHRSRRVGRAPATSGCG